MLSRLSLRAHDLEQALERIRSGTYGVCASCHGPIHRERLEALPETEVCLKCQLRLEEDEASPAPRTQVELRNGGRPRLDSRAPLRLPA
jgi:RNA polymerase-binding transcription factor DksA